MSSVPKHNRGPVQHHVPEYQHVTVVGLSALQGSNSFPDAWWRRCQGEPLTREVLWPWHTPGTRVTADPLPILPHSPTASQSNKDNCEMGWRQRRYWGRLTQSTAKRRWHHHEGSWILVQEETAGKLKPVTLSPQAVHVLSFPALEQKLSPIPSTVWMNQYFLAKFSDSRA